jgi:hypothetical protein
MRLKRSQSSKTSAQWYPNLHGRLRSPFNLTEVIIYVAISDREKERLNLTSPAANDVGLGDIIKELQTAGGGGPTSVTWADVTGKPATFAPSAHTHTAAQISDSSTVGKAVMTAADAAAARTAIGAGTSSLTIGTAASNAAAGNHTHDAAAIASGTLDVARIPTLTQAKVTNLTTDLAAKIAKSAVSGVTAIADPATATAEDVATKINALIAALKA